MKIFKRIHRAENATLTEVELLLLIAQNVDASGLYQYTDADTAEANNSTKTTINRLRNRLITNGYLTVRVPRQWLGEKGWSTVGVAISPKGFKTLVHNLKMGQRKGFLTDEAFQEHRARRIEACLGPFAADEQEEVHPADEPHVEEA